MDPTHRPQQAAAAEFRRVYDILSTGYTPFLDVHSRRILLPGPFIRLPSFLKLPWRFKKPFIRKLKRSSNKRRPQSTTVFSSPINPQVRKPPKPLYRSLFPQLLRRFAEETDCGSTCQVVRRQGKALHYRGLNRITTPDTVRVNFEIYIHISRYVCTNVHACTESRSPLAFKIGDFSLSGSALRRSLARCGAGAGEGLMPRIRLAA